MKKAIADLWIKALRSGKYKQGKTELCVVNGKNVKYDALGLLCHILKIGYKVKHNSLDNIKIKAYGEYGGISSIGECSLPDIVREISGIKTPLGYIPSLRDKIATMNDRGKSFKEIADVIEKYWREL